MIQALRLCHDESARGRASYRNTYAPAAMYRVLSAHLALGQQDEVDAKYAKMQQMFPAHIEALARAVLAAADEKSLTLATAESCTGGLVSALLTEIPGSSDVVDRAFVTYSNEAKTEMLGIPARVIAANGAVSREVALRMAENALLKSNADIAVSITGIAGPGGSEHKPAGLVHFGLAVRDRPGMCEVHRFGDRGRDVVRRQSVLSALRLLQKGVDLIV